MRLDHIISGVLDVVRAGKGPEVSRDYGVNPRLLLAVAPWHPKGREPVA
jgi:hypothetical protein